MGETSAELEREIEGLRRETTRLVEELEYRARRVTDARAQIADHPYLAGGLAVLLLTGIGLLVYRLYAWRREAAEPGYQARRRADELRAEIATERAAGARRRGRAPFFGQMLWTMFSAGMMSLATMVGRRLSTLVWNTAAKEQSRRMA